MRVLITADAQGGVWTYTVELVRELRALGVEPFVAVMGGRLGNQQKSAIDFPYADSDYRLEWMDDCWDDVRKSGEWLLDIERNWRPEIVHLNGYSHASLPWNCPALVVAHSCVLSWWRAVWNEPAPEEWNVYRVNVERGLRDAAAVVAPTRSMANALAFEHGISPSGITVIHNGLPAGAGPAPLKREVVFAAGRVWDQGKNLLLLDRIAHRLSVPVAIAGDTGEIKPRGTAEFTGPLPRRCVQGWMKQAAVFASPSKYEPFGLAALEAALAGCALVLSDIPSYRELWDGAALFADPNDEEAWIEQIHAAVSDNDLRLDLAWMAARNARNLNSERMAQQYLGLYSEMTGRCTS